ncbi:MAG: serine hydrolase [Acidobacteriota bacterium]
MPLDSIRSTFAILALAAGLGAATLHGQQPAPPVPGEARFAGLDRVVEEAITAGQTPGAVVLVGRGNAIVFEKAYGRRAVVPAPEPMTLDTIFDLASLTKVVATTTAVMKLVEEGRVRLNDPVARFVPDFERYGKGRITIRHLLTHVSGLRPDVDLADPWQGYDTAIELARNEVPTASPGERFVYSDINFFLLGEVVARVSGVRLDQYLAREVFEPLGMADTSFNPPAAKLGRIAPTERCAEMAEWPCNTPQATPLRGVVHDPTARRMGGVAGHAGLFSTARDLSRFARMLLNGGRLGTTEVLAAATVARMIAPSTPPGMISVRGLGWDIDTTYSSNRGELFPIGSFGHTGFTGTSVWIDPSSQTYVVFLSSRLHPDGKGDVTPLRGRVSTVAAAALSVTPAKGVAPAATGTDFGATPIEPAASSEPVRPGIDVLASQGFDLLKGKRVALLTNHTGRSTSGHSTIDVLHQALGNRLVALFSPEHGIRGVLDERVDSSRDERTGLPIHSLYGETRRPTDGMLTGLDTVVIDLQDVGTRFYTYMTSMAYVMEEAVKRRITVVVLDRPNPVNGWQIEGPTADEAWAGFTAYMPAMPVRHGMTLGELARLFNDELRIGVTLHVVPVANWRRDFWFDQTGLTWINPSPNMRNLNQATIYPGIGAIEASNISVGRGTDQPFEQIGAPWIDGRALAAALNARGLAGVRFYPVTFTPASSKYAGQACQGVFMVITNRAALQPVRVGLEVAAALWKLHGDEYRMEGTARLLGSEKDLLRVKAGEDPGQVAAGWRTSEARWRQRRAKYLMYR